METQMLNPVVSEMPEPRKAQGGVPTRPLMGLSEREAQLRRSQGLGNAVQFKTSRSYLEILRHNLFTFFNMVLFGLGVALVLLGQPVEALITSGVMLINVLVAVIQEMRAKVKLDHIALLTRPKAAVIRDGQEKIIDPGEIVKGDILTVSPGDQIVVDGRLVGDGRVNVDESLITGEADLVAKGSGDMLYSGSFCVAGKATYLAQKVGSESLANTLTSSAREFVWEYTPLQSEVNLIIRVLLGVVAFFLLLATFNTILGETSLVESVRTASVLFGLAPNSLFLMIVVAYAWAAVRLAGKGALVQQANSVESLCNVTVLCLDKTGTLTTNRIQLEEMLAIDQSLARQLPTDLHHILGTYASSVTSTTRTSQAVLDAFPGRGMAAHEEVLFTSELGWSALSFEDGGLKGTYVLGAPEKLIAALAPGKQLITGSGGTLGAWINKRTARGMRVLLFAYRPKIIALHDDKKRALLPPNMLPLCLLCFSDELRSNVRETLEGFVDLGVKLKIISGDNPGTVLSLAKQAGLDQVNGALQAVSGLELAEMETTTFAKTASEADIFGRVTPYMKERLVKSLREEGHYVAMTGDGVNDVMALKRANLGIAMQSGSPAARNVADMILLGDSFAVLPQAFAEGQRILNGMQDILKLYMTRILYFALLIAAMGWLGNGSPFTPKQNSLISLLTLSVPAFALALWARPGPVPKQSLTQRLLHFILPAAILSSLAGIIVFLYFLFFTRDVLYARQALTYTMIVTGLLLLVFVEPPSKIWVSGDKLSGDRRPALLAGGLLLVFFAFLAIPPLRELYDLALLRRPLDYAVVGLVVLLWAVSLRAAWRARLLDRYLNVDLGGPTNS